MDVGQVTTVQPPSMWRMSTEFRTRHRRCGWRGMLGVVALMLFPGIVIPEGTVQAVGPTIRASVTHDWVQGDGYASATSVDVWVTESDGSTIKGSITVTSDSSGHFDVSRDQLGVDIVFGDRVFADDAVSPKDVTMTFPLSIAVDRDPALAYGSLPTGAEVQVYVTGTLCEQSVSVLDSDNDSGGPADGDWEYDFSSACPEGLGFFERGEVNFHDGDGDATVAEPVSNFQIGASIYEDWITGSGFLPDAPVEIWINTDPLGPATLTVGTDYAGGFQTDAGVNLVGTDEIDVGDGVSSKSMTLADPLSIDVDSGPPAGASGTLPTGDGVQLWIWGSDCSASAFVLDSDNDALDDGDWAVDLSTDCPTGLGTDHGGVALHFDSSDNFTQVQMREPAQFSASVTSNWVSGGGFESDAGVEIWINADPDIESATGATGTDSMGNFHWDSGLDLDFGDGVVVRDSTIERALILTGPLSIEADLDAMTAFGTLPSGATVQVQMGGEHCGTGMPVADIDDGTVDGNWGPVDLSGDCPGGLGPNSGAQVLLFDDDRDATVAEPIQPPRIQASMSSFSDFVQGNGFVPGVSGDVTINPGDPGELFFEDVFEPEPNGDWRIDPGIDLVGADVVLVEQDPDGVPASGDEIVKDTVLVEFAFDLIDPDNDTAEGTATAPDGTEVHANVGNQFDGTGGFGTVTGGVWTVDFSPFDVTGDMGGQAFIGEQVAPDGDATAAEPQPGPRIQVSMAHPFNDFVQGNGFVPGVSGDVTINPGDPGELFFEDIFEPDPNGDWRINPGIDLVGADVVLVEQDPDGVPASGDELVKGTVVVELTLDTVDVDENVVEGTTGVPDGTDIWVELWNQHEGSGMGTTASSGAWAVDFDDIGFDITDDMGGQARVDEQVSPDGDATVAELIQPPRIQASMASFSDLVQGNGWMPFLLGDITVNPGDPGEIFLPDAFEPNEWGGWRTDPGIDLLAGDVVLVEQDLDGVPANGDELVKDTVLLEFALDGFDADADTASGTAAVPDGTEVYANVGNDFDGTDGFGTVTGGVWTIDFSPFDVTDDMGGQAFIDELILPDGDSTVAEPAQPATIQVNVTDDWVNGVGFAPDTLVEIWVSPAAPPDPATYDVMTDGQGQFWSNPPLDLVFGQEIVASDGVVEKTLTLTELSIDSFDPVAVSADGTLPPYAEISVDLHGQFCGTGAWLADDDGDGQWSVDLSGDCPGGLGPQAWSQASLSDDDGDATFVSGPRPPQIRGSVQDDWIDGQGFEPDSTVDISINAVPIDTVETDGQGNFNYGAPLDLLGDDIIVVSDGVVTRELQLDDPLTIDADYDALTASGELPNYAGVLVDMGGQFCGASIFVLDEDDGNPADGLWQATMPPDCPGGLGPDQWAQAQLFDDDGDATVASAARPPMIQASEENDWISGQGFTPDSNVELWVNVDPADPATAAIVSDGGGSFWMDQTILGGLDLVVGDTVVASDGVIERLLVIEGPLSIVADFATLTATGLLPDTRSVVVQLNGQFCGASAFVNDGDDGLEDGIFQADLSGDCGGWLGPDGRMQVSLYDDDGDATVAHSRSAPQIQASELDNWIGGQGFEPHSPIDVWINVDPANPPTASTTSDGDGQFWLDPAADLMVGDTVVASDSVLTRELTLEGPLSIVADYVAVTAAGGLPSGATVGVDLQGQDCGARAFVSDSDDGSDDGLWSVDLSGQCPGGLGPNVWAQAQLYDNDGDATVARAAAPARIGASVVGDWVGGESFAPNTNVDVSVNGSPAASVLSDDGGQFWADSATLGLDLVVGDEIDATDGSTSRYLQLEGPLSIAVDLGAASAFGELLPGSAVEVNLNGSNCDVHVWVEDGYDGTVDGLWSLDASGTCPDGLGGYYGGQVRLYDSDGDATVAEPSSPPQIRASVTHDSIEGEGFVPNSTVDIWLNADPAVDPPVLTVGTDGGGWFSTDAPVLGNFVLGDVVIASDGTSEKTLVLEGPLTIDVSPSPAGASGELPAGTTVQVLTWSSCGQTFQVLQDGWDGAVDGFWSLDLSAECPGGLGGSWDAAVTRFDPDGDGTVVAWVPPVDLDVDGLTDAEELNIYGTDPGDDDTDNDGLTDGAEVNTFATKPLVPDTDGDGLTDGAEVNTYKTNPNKPDTDGDGLKDGEEVNTYSTKPLVPDTDDDGLTDGAEVNTYSTDPNKPDTDNDGLEDGEEVNVYNTKPLKPDTDGGTVNDGDEVANGTDPLDPDDDIAGPPLEPLVPARVLETRTGPNDVTYDGLFQHLGRQPAGSTLELLIAGRGGVPVDAEAVIMNLTAVFPSAPGYLTVFPCGEARPKASNVNYAAGVVAPNAVLAKIGTGGKVCIFTLAETDLIADVNGFVPVGGSPGSLVPARVLETRTGPNDVTYDGLFQHLGRQPAGSTLELSVAGRGGVPVDAEAVIMNLTAVFPSAPGYLTVFPCGEARPKASNVNYAAGDVAPNAVLAKIGTDGKVCIFTLAETDLIADVNGYVPVGGSPGSLVPARVLETRTGPNDVTYDGLFQHLGRQPAGSTLELSVAGRGGVPVDAEAVMLNATAVFPSAPGYLTVFPCGEARPKASNVNYAAGDVAPNAVLAKIGTDGKVCIYTLAETDIVVDVLGYV